MVRSFISVIEQLDKIHDVVIIDVAGLRGSLQLALQRIADTYILVANLEVASVFSTIQAIQKVSDTQSKNDFRILLNARTTQGLPRSLVQSEIIKSAELLNGQVLQSIIPFSQSLLSWPGSVGSMFLASGKKVEQALRSILIEIGYLEKEVAPSVIQPVLKQLIEKTSENLRQLRFHKSKQITKKISIANPELSDSTTHVLKAIEAPRKALPTIE
jgi:MinD-like ATPase involved in chromosome partitioning or flagellar assembly